LVYKRTQRAAWGTGWGEGGSQRPTSKNSCQLLSPVSCRIAACRLSPCHQSPCHQSACRLDSKEKYIKIFYPYTLFEIPLSKKVRYPDHTTYRGLIKHCYKTSDFKNRGHFSLKKSLLKSSCPFTFFKISLFKKDRLYNIWYSISLRLRLRYRFH